MGGAFMPLLQQDCLELRNSAIAMGGFLPSPGRASPPLDTFYSYVAFALDLFTFLLLCSALSKPILQCFVGAASKFVNAGTWLFNTLPLVDMLVQTIWLN